jgi:hypothetical protein
MLDVKGKRGLGYATHGVQQLGSRGCNIKFNKKKVMSHAVVVFDGLLEFLCGFFGDSCAHITMTARAKFFPPPMLDKNNS